MEKLNYDTIQRYQSFENKINQLTSKGSQSHLYIPKPFNQTFD